MYIFVKSLCCISETNIIFYINYITIKIISKLIPGHSLNEWIPVSLCIELITPSGMFCGTKSRALTDGLALHWSEVLIERNRGFVALLLEDGDGIREFCIIY